MNILHLTLKKKWFDMILSGEKKEEYRNIKPYWIQRLTWHEYHLLPADLIIDYSDANKDIFKRSFDCIEFKNGYSKNAPTFKIELKSIGIGWGKYEWGAGAGICFVMKMGNVVKPLVNHI